MTHLTLNTGHSCPSPRSLIAEGLIQQLAPLVRESGTVNLHIAPWRVVLTREDGLASFDFRRGSDASGLAVLCLLVWSEAGRKAWPVFESVYLGLADAAAKAGTSDTLLQLPQEPASLPYLAVVILPGLLHFTAAEDVSWLGDAERTIAWAILENP